jgi:hypothetical protein
VLALSALIHVPPIRQQQSYCRNAHGNRRDPAERVAHASVDLPLHDRAIVADQHDHHEQWRRDDSVQYSGIVQRLNWIDAEQIDRESK